VESGTLIVAEEDASGLQVLTSLEVPAGDEVSVGREGRLRIGAVVPDSRVSREAASVSRTVDGWRVRSSNRNGVIVHPWAQPARVAQPVELLRHEFVALRIVGQTHRRHWLLMEDTNTNPPSPMPTLRTELRTPPRPLTSSQVEVLECLFGELLAWPPIVGCEPLQLKQVARQIGVSMSAVQARLVEVRAKAEGLGLSRQVPLTDPEYLYVLVGAQYFRAHDHVQRRT
jgi:hypothetical protein